MREMCYWVRRTFVVLAMACMPLCPEMAKATTTTTNLTIGQSIGLSSIVQGSGESIQIGDKLFSNFSFSYVDTDNKASDDLKASDVTLTALNNQFGYGFSMQMPLATASNITKDVVIKFSVLVLDPTEKISSIHLDMNASASGMGLADVSETVFTNGFGSGNIAHLDVSTATVLAANVPLPVPQSMLYIEKDIIVSSGNCNLAQDAAAICAIEQNLQQVPEPSALVLSAMGLLGLLSLRSVRRRHNGTR